MSEIILTSEQRSIIDSPERRIVVRAAAGSGKTRVLVERYLRHIAQDGLRPDEILAITFTRKAAAEMKTRIVARLQSLGLQEAAQIAETGPISTIHSFCERTLRENCIAARLDPRYEITSEGRVAALRNELVQEEITFAEHSGPYVQALLKVLAGKGGYQMESALSARLESDISEVISKFRGTLWRVEELEAIYRTPAELARYAEEHWSELHLEGTADKLLAGFRGEGAKEEKVVEERRHLELVCGLMQMALAVWKRLDQHLLRSQTLDYALLEQQLLNLLTESPETCARLRRQYRVVLVDEAQDLNPVQHRILELLDPETEMLVGDPQQSIYGFRLAEMGLFIEKATRAAQFRQTTNFRSTSTIIQTIDETFASQWGDFHDPMSPAPAAGPGETEVWKLGGADGQATAQWIRSQIESGEKPGDIVILIRNFRHGELFVPHLKRLDIPHRQIGTTRFFTRLQIRDLANILEALSNPQDEFALAALLRSPIVGVSLDSVVRLTLDAQELAKPFLKALEDAENLPEEDQKLVSRFLEWFSPLSRHADRLTAWEVLSEVFGRTDYLERVAADHNPQQALANIRKLHRQAIENHNLSPTEFAEWIRHVQSINHREEDAPAVDDREGVVRIMTVHKSKGLEFPVVVIPHTFFSLPKSRSVVVDRRTGLVGLSADDLKPKLLEAVKKSNAAQDTAEEQRLLYVAMTRAQRKLCVAVGAGVKGLWNASLMKGLRVASEPLEWLTIRESGTQPVN